MRMKVRKNKSRSLAEAKAGVTSNSVGGVVIGRSETGVANQNSSPRFSGAELAHPFGGDSTSNFVARYRNVAPMFRNAFLGLAQLLDAPKASEVLLVSICDSSAGG